MSLKVQRLGDDSLVFNCPGCGWPHRIQIGKGPGPRWDWNGSESKPTFSPSVKVTQKYTVEDRVDTCCHSFVKEGRIQFLNDCTHELAGQTVDLPDISE